MVLYKSTKESIYVKCVAYQCAETCLSVANIPDQPVSGPVQNLNEGDEAAANAESHESSHLSDNRGVELFLMSKVPRGLF